ncbi:hypothetical protein NDU88_002417 [Pleurodeles waltl]|uniref:Uncharacterized protein n=1 Tax=Pleurodeles waltl TaxID=8319 RepID=A0AAV7W4H7_PLEWA|nr:hypothetical protein NDU88_002417 [Pleurodeles waltl]
MVEGGKWWNKRKVAKVDTKVDAQRIWIEDRFTGGFLGGLMSDVSVGDRTFGMEGQDVGTGMSVAEECEGRSRLDQVCDEEETMDVANNNVVTGNANGDGKEFGERVHGDFRKSKWVIMKPKYLEDYVLD